MISVVQASSKIPVASRLLAIHVIQYCCSVDHLFNSLLCSCGNNTPHSTVFSGICLMLGKQATSVCLLRAQQRKVQRVVERQSLLPLRKCLFTARLGPSVHEGSKYGYQVHQTLQGNLLLESSLCHGPRPCLSRTCVISKQAKMRKRNYS